MSMAAAAAEQRHASAGLAQDLSSLQPPDLLRTMAADGGLDDIPDPTAMTSIADCSLMYNVGGVMDRSRLFM